MTQTTSKPSLLARALELISPKRDSSPREAADQHNPNWLSPETFLASAWGGARRR